MIKMLSLHEPLLFQSKATKTQASEQDSFIFQHPTFSAISPTLPTYNPFLPFSDFSALYFTSPHVYKIIPAIPTNTLFLYTSVIL